MKNKPYYLTLGDVAIIKKALAATTKIPMTLQNDAIELALNQRIREIEVKLERHEGVTNEQN